jgi:hypothetical protein
MIFDDYMVLDNCQNIQKSYGEICVQCNKCRRFDKKDETLKNESEDK